MRQRILLEVEFLTLFLVLPTTLTLGLLPLPRIPTLLAVAGFCLITLLRDPAFPRQQLWNGKGKGRALREVFLVFLVAAAAITAGVLLLAPGSFLSLARRAPAIWAAVMILYPILSVYPQELIFRAFLFHRYRPLFAGPEGLIFLSACDFPKL